MSTSPQTTVHDDDDANVTFASTGAAALTVSGVSKRFGAVQALDDVSIELAPGEIHALVGENGSGKSTLVKIVAGAVGADAGTVTIGGRWARRPTPSASRRLGAHTVFQDGSLIPELSVAQNMYLGSVARDRPGYGGIETWTRDVLARRGIVAIHPATRAGAVGAGDQQLIEITRAVNGDPTVLLLDEATSALDATGVDHALRLVGDVAGRGSAVLFVTHRLSEVFRVAHRITVLRDGRWQGTFAASDIDQRKLVELMAGASVDVEFPVRQATPADAPVAIAATDVTLGPIGPLNIEVRAGELLGVAGADGNGQLDLLRALARVEGGRGVVTIGGTAVASYREAVQAGAIYLSGDRANESLLAALSVRENLSVSVLEQLSRAGLLRRADEDEHARAQIAQYGIRVGDSEHAITSLSGGNQQKVAISRVLATEPRVLLVEEPTQGVDVRSRMDIYRFLRAAADEGLAVVLVSSDASELAGVADRIVVMSRGRIVEEIDGIGATEESIVRSFTGVTHVAPVDGRSDVSTRDVALVASRPPAHLRAVNDFTRLSVLVLGLALIAGYARLRNDTFFSHPSLNNIALLAVPLAIAAIAQFCVLVVGGLDIAVGGTMALTVVALSFAATSGGLAAVVGIALLVALGVGLAVGLTNALLIVGTKVSAVIATIATLGATSGLALVLRPTAEGLISSELGTVFKDGPWFLPWPLIGVAGVVVVADLVLWRSGPGLVVRAAGLSPLKAQRLGVPTQWLMVLAYLTCGVLAAVAGVMLAAQVSIGDATVGGNFTLLAIAAPVLGGASLLGGRGSFIGCLVGAIVLALTQALPQILGISDATGYLLTGVLTLAALLAYSSRRGPRRSPPAVVGPLPGAESLDDHDEESPCA
jgi:ribose transport system ATP-binding protein